ncbi:MAG: MFS transporter, partial [Janthinobacterium sp.]
MKPALRVTLLHALFGWLNLSLTAPGIYLWLGLPLIMRQHGWSGLDIGLFQLAGLPALFKFALALPVECLRGPADAGTQRYRPWAIALCLLLAAVMLLMGWRELLHSRGELFALACAVALLTTWADIPVNALAIRVLPEAQRLRAGGIRSAAMSLGAIVGGGVMLLLQTRWGWRAPFWLMAAAIAVGAAGHGFAMHVTDMTPQQPRGAGGGLVLPLPVADVEGHLHRQLLLFNRSKEALKGFDAPAIQGLVVLHQQLHGMLGQ